MRTPTITLTLAATLLALTACTSTSTSSSPSAERSLTATEREDAAKAAGIPPVPAGAKRDALLAAIRAVSPEAAAYEDKAVEAARNQCSALNSPKANWLAAQRFSYKGQQVTETQGKALNAALRKSGLCNL